MSDNNNTNTGIGFWGMLQIVFIVLKLTGNITWPWGLVLAPTWFGIAFWVVIIGGIGIFMNWDGISGWFVNLNDKMRKVFFKDEKEYPVMTICWSCGEPYDADIHVSCPHCENE